MPFLVPTNPVVTVSGIDPVLSTGGSTPAISIQDGTVEQKGAVQLEDSISSDSVTKAATPKSVKEVYDYAITVSGSLQIDIDGKSDVGHTHDDRYYTEAEADTISGSLSTEIDSDISTHSSSGDHDDRYYTETEVDDLITTISGKLNDHDELNNLDYASSGHTGFQPAGDYVIGAELISTSGTLQSQIDGKSDTGHIHTESDITDLDKHTQSEVNTISGTLNTKISGKDNYQSWTFQIDGVDKDDITSGDKLNFVSGDNITIIRTVDDQITISGSEGVTNHSQLNELDYVSAGHTGFASTDDLTTVSGDLQTNIDDKSDIGHNHDNKYYTETELDNGQLDNRYYIESEIDTISGSLQIEIDGKSNIGHIHDDLYYTEAEIDTLSGTLQTNIDGKPDTDHFHDDRYYTESEIDTISGTLDTKIDGKDNYSSWSFAVDGVIKDAVISGDVLDFVGGDNIIVTRSADDQITISGTPTGGEVSDIVYGDSWNGVTVVAPSKNAVYDKIKSMSYTENLIGVVGTAGFGVGICPTQLVPDGMTPLAGYDNVASDNYGNYQYRDGSIMCWIPRFYYKISTLTTDIKGIDVYATETLANAAGYAMHRAFIDGGIDQQGFFCDKYKCSKNVWGTGQIASSLPNGLPITTGIPHNRIADLTACAGNDYYEVINAAHGRDGVDGAVNSSSIFHATTVFQHGAIALLSLAHGQAVSNTVNCAWYDATYNYPKGCNNNALKDYDEVTNGAGSGDDLLYVTDGHLQCGKTGSGAPFAKCTHNGQACGIADVNGLVSEINLGLVRSGTTDSENINDNLGTTKFYVLKESVSAKDLTSGWTTAAGTAGSTAWGDAAYLEGPTSSYDLIDLSMIGKATGSVCFGNSANQVLDAATSGAGWLRTGLGIYLDAGSSATGTNLFGKDELYEYHRSNLCVVSCGYWNKSSPAGVWNVILLYSRNNSNSHVGLRLACYPGYS